MENRVGAGRLTKNVRVDQQIVVIPEEGIVKRGVVVPYLAAIFGQERTVVGEGGADLGCQSVVDAFLAAPDGYGPPVWVPEAQANANTISGSFSEHPGHMRIGLGEERAGEDEDVDPLSRFLQQTEPGLPRNAGAVWVGAHKLDD